MAQALPQNPTQFDVTGIIQQATLLNATDPLSGGTITLNNQTIIVPTNTILQMPATALTWQQVFSLAPAPWGPTQSGLALADVPPPKAGFEAHIVGNRVGNSYIAGLIWLTQNSLQNSSGFINHIDYATGFFRVGGTIGDPNTGQRVKINDPEGKFSRQWTIDPRFTIDENNPTCCAGTGFPMGIPRGINDPLCPQSNRPIDPAQPSGFAMIFTMPAPQLVFPGGPDPRVMAPFEVGDWVTYSGILADDGAPFVAAFAVQANVGIYTAPGTDPAFVLLEDGLLGVGGTTVAGLAEATTRTRFEGMTTDPSRNINIFGVDVDNCSAAATDRDWGISAVDPGAPAGAVLGRWRFRPAGGGGSTMIRGPLSGSFLPATREVRVEIAGSTHVVTANGLVSGQYQAPIGEYLFPENGAPGTPLVANNFEDMPFLVAGSGTLGANGPIIAQLTPWPGAAAPSFTRCGTAANVAADAGVDRTVASGSLVTLAGTGAGGPAGTLYSFAWSQVGGTAVVLSGANTATPSFTAPLVPAGTARTLMFQLTVTGAGLSGTDLVSITVNPVVADIVSIGTVEFRRDRARLTVNAGSTAAASNPAARLLCQPLDGNGQPIGPAVDMGPPAGGVYTLVQVGVAQPTTVRVTSSYGGSATSPITRLR